MIPIPPRYSVESTLTVPTYSSEPLAGEQRLQLNPPVLHRPIPDGTFTRENGRVSLLLTQQEDGALLPTYGRNATIRGVLFLKNTDKIFAVTLKVHMLCFECYPVQSHHFVGGWHARAYRYRGWDKLHRGSGQES
jgi:hypothetical protein